MHDEIHDKPTRNPLKIPTLIALLLLVLVVLLPLVVDVHGHASGAEGHKSAVESRTDTTVGSFRISLIPWTRLMLQERHWKRSPLTFWRLCDGGQTSTDAPTARGERVQCRV